MVLRTLSIGRIGLYLSTMNLQMNRWILVFAALITLASAADSESKYCIYIYIYIYVCVYRGIN